jgi:Mg2+-importing ATPase
VDDVFVERPHRMDIGFIRRFMLVFGSLSSLFDYATFAVLIWLMKANQQSFQTGWFIESILSACVVVFAVRTRLPFTRSQPSHAMLAVTGMVILITLWLPYSPLAALLGFTPLPVPYLLVIFGIVALYFVSAELTKRWFYRQTKNNG